MKAPILSTEGVTVRFGGNTALSDMSVDAIEGVVTGLIGPNGAGKTCLLYTSPSPRDRTRSRMPSSA